METSNRKLVVIGAGPKGIAIAAKHHVLRQLGADLPDLHIIERNGVGAHWTGENGYTNGRLMLGTAPEKDLGFPYRSQTFAEGKRNDELNRGMAAFSWSSYRIARGDYADWVDRGRPAPSHGEWAAYLRWVARRCEASVLLHHGEVCRLAIEDGRWRVSFRVAGGSLESLLAEGLVLTGPGKPAAPADLPTDARILTAETFWQRLPDFRGGKCRIGIIGSGESAAAIAIALGELADGNDGLRISIVCPQGMTYSRGESFYENRVYSDATHGDWRNLSLAHRREFLGRSDRGVFSLYAQSQLARLPPMRIVPGRLRQVRAERELCATIVYENKIRVEGFDFLVIAAGSDPLATLRELTDDTTRALLPQLCEERLAGRIDVDLAVRDLHPHLHLPMLSGLEQGPGFANLSCLGRLSDRILNAYQRRTHDCAFA